MRAQLREWMGSAGLLAGCATLLVISQAGCVSVDSYDAMQGRTLTLEGELQAKATELAQVQASLQEAVGKAEGLGGELESLRSQMQAEQTKTGEAATALAAAQARVTELQGAAQRASQEVTGLTGEREKLTQELTAARGQLEALRQQLDGARTQIETLRQEVAKLQGELEKARAPQPPAGGSTTGTPAPAPAPAPAGPAPAPR